MTASIAGLVVCAGLLGLGFCLRAPVVVGLFASLPFGSTAFLTIGALGGASPLIYTLFVLLLFGGMVLRRRIFHELAYLFRNSWVPWIVLALTLYCIGGALVLPRLFAGQTSALVAVPGRGVFEMPLVPVSGNITQTAYLLLSSLMFYVFCIVLRMPHGKTVVRRGYFTWAAVHAALGLVDLGSKLIGAGDVMLPIRTASYSLLTEVEEAGFWRLTGGFSEASAFGAVTLSCLAFSFSYWRATKSRSTLCLCILLACLLLASTSSTAYAGGGILAAGVLISIACSGLRGRMTLQDVVLLLTGVAGLTAIGAIYLYNENLFHPVLRLIESTLIDKASSESAQERGYWNYRNIQSFIDTAGLGIGLGSSRASSWPIAVLSQLGVIGAVLVIALVAVILRGPMPRKPAEADRTLVALSWGARASIVASLIAGSMIGSGVDPGLLFFIGLAVIVTCNQVPAEVPAHRSFGPHYAQMLWSR